MLHARTWMNLENVMPGEKSQTQKATYYMILQRQKVDQWLPWAVGDGGVE